MQTDLQQRLKKFFDGELRRWRKKGEERNGSYSETLFGKDLEYINQLMGALRRDGWTIGIGNESDGRGDGQSCFVLNGSHLEIECDHILRSLVEKGAEISYPGHSTGAHWSALVKRLESNGCIVSDTNYPYPRCTISIDPATYQQAVDLCFSGTSVKPEDTEKPMATDQPMSTTSSTP